MIVFSCSQAFAAFIEPKKTGQSPHPSAGGPHLIGSGGLTAATVREKIRVLLSNTAIRKEFHYGNA